MSWVATGVGAATAIGGAVNSANASHSAAFQQQSAAARFRDWSAGQQTTNDNLVLNPAAIAAQDQALTAQESQVQRQEQLAQSINPALIEQGKQYMQLLQGQSAPVLKNLQDQRALQRQQLVQQLQTQMGPGAETSTAGQQALNQFDQQTSNTLNQAQIQYTGMLGQMTMAAPGVANQFGVANQQLADINANSPQNMAAKVNMGLAGTGAQAQQAGVASAGASAAGQAVLGQAALGIGSSLLGTGLGRSSQPPGGPTAANPVNSMPTGQPYMPGGSTLGNDYNFNSLPSFNTGSTP